MSNFPRGAAALVAGLFVAQSAMADVVFDPKAGNASFIIDETTDSLTIDIQGFGFVPSALGTYFMNEEPPFTTFGSDSITVSNTGANGWGVIALVSADLPRATTTCNGAADESTTGTFAGQTVPAGHCYLDLPLAVSGGTDLFVDVFSPAGDLTNNPGFSDSIDITVPEPVSITLLGFGLGALGLVRRRR
jgi:hypothetical protein